MIELAPFELSVMAAAASLLTGLGLGAVSRVRRAVKKRPTVVVVAIPTEWVPTAAEVVADCQARGESMPITAGDVARGRRRMRRERA